MIPLIDMERQHRSLKDEIHREIRDVLDRGQFIMGRTSKALEK